MMNPIQVEYASGSVSATVHGYPTVEELQELHEWVLGFAPHNASVLTWTLEPQPGPPGQFRFSAQWSAPSKPAGPRADLKGGEGEWT